ncbi:hypothetical protein Sango_3092300 [Sesamum angolense]|uniref:Reverse transcriptase n=1 Tax=Sesamum angolense TaxID=2727404 RepID=A0AAE1VYL4_9LAMI|nr:hypothetical protein Sango_3092300 [Sesamum angolense]
MKLDPELRGSVIHCLRHWGSRRAPSGQILGLPLISARLSMADCQPLLQKIDSRIKEWEGVQLSFAGRVQLIKSVLISFEVTQLVVTQKWLGRRYADRLRKVASVSKIFLPERALMSKHLWAVIKQDRTSIWVEWIIQLTRTGLLDKLSVVIKDGQWNWPLITNIACLEITHMLPPILEGRTESVGSLRGAPSKPRQLMIFSTHQDPRFSGPLFDGFLQNPKELLCPLARYHGEIVHIG